MNDYLYILAQLKKHRGQWPSIAKAAKVPLRSLEKIARQEIKSPSWQSINKLNTYFRGLK